MAGKRQKADNVMGISGWLGIAVGVGVVALHAATRIFTHHLALRAPNRQEFVVWELGGLSGRMALVFCAVAVILLYAPVHAVSFTSTVLVLLLLSMVVEVRLIVRAMDRGTMAS